MQTNETHHSHASHDHGAHGACAGHGAVDQDSARRIRYVLAMIASFMVVEILVGVWSHSLVLIADGVHMLSDALALALSLVALYLARRRPDARRSYGYQRAQVLAAFVNGLAMFVLSGWIVFEAVQRLWRPETVIAGPMLGVATLGLLINIVAAWILHRGDQDNLNMQGALLHVMGDLLGSVAAIAAGLIIWQWGWQRADPLLSLLAAVLVLRSAWVISRQAAHVLLEGTPERIDTEQVRQALVSVPGTQAVHDLHVWGLSHKDMIVTAHLVVNDSTARDTILEQAGALLADRFGIEHVTLQIEGQACLTGSPCEQHQGAGPRFDKEH